MVPRTKKGTVKRKGKGEKGGKKKKKKPERGVGARQI